MRASKLCIHHETETAEKQEPEHHVEKDEKNKVTG